MSQFYTFFSRVSDPKFKVMAGFQHCRRCSRRQRHQMVIVIPWWLRNYPRRKTDIWPSWCMGMCAMQQMVRTRTYEMICRSAQPCAGIPSEGEFGGRGLVLGVVNFLVWFHVIFILCCMFASFSLEGCHLHVDSVVRSTPRASLSHYIPERLYESDLWAMILKRPCELR